MSALPRYRLLKRLGAGAAGGVYLVEDRVQGGPPLALKCVESASDPAFRATFAREFAVLASLSLPGVAPVYDLGTIPEGADLPAGPFFTRAYVAGEPLDAACAGRSLEERAALFLRGVEIVSALHRLGVVHGDLKPANIIVDAQGAPHLIDFGLSTHAADASRVRGSGTPLYMAPELFQGAAPSIACDVYALGATLWTLVTGAPPFAERGPQALSAKLNGEAPRIDGAMAGMQRRLAEVASAALRADRPQRTPSADELAALVERCLGRAARPTDEAGAPRFVAPRPRGRDELLATLEANSTSSAPRGTLLEGPLGIGKSTLLRELKWRLQLASRPVLEVQGRGLAAPQDQLLEQAAFLHGKSVADLPSDRGEALVTALSALEGARLTLLLDDLDAVDAAFVQGLSAALHELGPRGPAVIAAAESLAAEQVAAFAWDVQEVPGLTPDVATELVGEVLENPDQALTQALVSRAEGNPGRLVEALFWVVQRPDLTAAEVAQLPLGSIGAGAAQARLARLSERARDLLALVVAARGRLPEALAHALFGARAGAASEELIEARMLRAIEAQLVLKDEVLANFLREHAAERVRAQAERALALKADVALSAALEAELAYAARDMARVAARVHDAARELCERGDARAALRLAEGLREAEPASETSALRLLLMELHAQLGDAVRSAAYADSVLADPHATASERGRARVGGGRALVAAGDLGRAVPLLSDLPDDLPQALRAQASRELARLHLRRGEDAHTRAAVERGLAACGPHDPARPELLAIDGMLASMAGERARADERFKEAWEAARRGGVRRDEAQVLGYQAICEERDGDLARAASTYSEALAAAREASDLGLMATYALNLGNVSFRSGETDRAADHFAQAARFARRAGRMSTALLAQNNLAHVHLYLGAFERARALVEASSAEAERLNIEVAAAQAQQLSGDVAARTGQSEAALSRYEAAAVGYERLQRHREWVEVLLDTAEVLLDRGGASDASAASAKLARARALAETHRVEDLRPRLRLLLARARGANGDVEGAIRELERLAQEGAAFEHNRELSWQLPAAQAQLYRWTGSELLARKKLLEAAEAVEREAARVPRASREAYRSEPRRRAVLDAGSGMLSVVSASPEPTTTLSSTAAARFARLLELLKRLARERDLDRLLERITDAAVELSGAERGFVLLVDAQGQLSTHTVRTSGGADHDAHLAFSRSIAEAVLIDGEPILTTNARDDRRVNEFMSVHKLMLKSVACIPIAGPEQVLGVLYLEHRLRAGRFQEADLDLLMAFADQVAIALENARLWSENERKQKELADKNAELEAAKRDIERLLEARTEELEQAQQALSRARAELAMDAQRYGIVGRSQAMRQVIALLERVRETNVPVVVHGESGTGKELAARAIHAGGPRSRGPFVAVNCGAVPEALLESELFGHVRGAFTGADRDKKGLFAQAHGGTLFLDEFADIPARMQVDLLRVLQEGKVRPVGAEHDVAVDVRVIVATRRPLAELVREGKVREDLYYRLGVVEVRMPPLRERLEDVPLLCDHFLRRMAQTQGTRPKRLSRAALERIQASGLPGNVRQLEHLLMSAAMMADGSLIDVRDLPLALQEPQGEGSAEALADAREPQAQSAHASDTSGSDLPPSDLRAFKQRERQRILDALERHAWNRAKAANALGMPRRTFYRRLTEFGIL